MEHRSIWTEETELPQRQPLEKDTKTEVAVIGAGLAGVLTAYLLEKQGARTLILEAGRTGCGQTKNTTAKITVQHGLIYGRLLEDFGEEKARQYAEANLQAVEQYKRIIRDQAIECDFTECAAYLYAMADPAPLEKEWEAARSLGIEGALCGETELPFPVKGALRFDHQAHFHPLRFLKALAQDLNICEETPVRTVEGDQVVTDRGTVRAERVVFACHYPFLNAPGFYFARMHQERSYVVALENAGQMEGMYLGIDGEQLSFRPQGDLLLLGGGGHRTGENSAGGRYTGLEEAARRYWPDCRVRAMWSAQDCMTLDHVPYIGRYSAATPDWYVATGFGKWGMTTSMAAATLLCDLITGKTAEEAPIFSPQRWQQPSATAQMMKEGTQAVKGLTRRVFKAPEMDLSALPVGHGGVVEWKGEKVGVYKDGEGKVHAVSVKCPHLGCQVEWNPDEKSWDCPCHGSRFDYQGNLIDNPAQEDPCVKTG